MYFQITIIVLVTLLLCGDLQSKSVRPYDMSFKGPFKRMKRAILQKNEKLFAKQWSLLGYNMNLVGGSGIPGKSVYKQATRKGWYMKPDFKKMIKVSNKAWIVTCNIWSWKRKKAVDQVHALVVQPKNKWLLLGAGEKLKEVRSLSKRRKKIAK